jgi:hypothetical protein
MEDDLQWKTASNGRQPPMEDDLQQKTTSNERRTPMEDELQWKTTYKDKIFLKFESFEGGKTQNIKLVLMNTPNVRLYQIL